MQAASGSTVEKVSNVRTFAVRAGVVKREYGIAGGKIFLRDHGGEWDPTEHPNVEALLKCLGGCSNNGKPTLHLNSLGVKLTGIKGGPIEKFGVTLKMGDPPARK